MWGVLERLSSLLTPPPNQPIRAEDHTDLQGTHSPSRSGQQSGIDLQSAGSVQPMAAETRVATKLKGYFSLAKSSIDKAIRAEEWGLPADALQHYQVAQSILAEGLSIPVQSYVGAANDYRQKMLKWQHEVNSRIEVLSHRLDSNRLTLDTNQNFGVQQSSKGNRNSATARMPNSHSNSLPKARIPTGVPGVDPKLLEMIENEVLDRSPAVNWDSIAGLDKAKQALLEMVILPIKRKDLFTGLRKPARGILLFGPPGNGKTLLGKAVASESSATFFCISASSLTSKWVGEGEKLMRALFAVAKARQPSVIFMDEIDSIMSSRSSNEHEASRRLKSEFLVQFDGAMSNKDDQVVVMGATNRPQDLDDAVRRRLVKRIYIPLPDHNTRRDLLNKLLRLNAQNLSGSDVERIARETEGYSGSDLHALCQEAAMIPIRELGSRISTIRADQIRPLTRMDFQIAMNAIRPSTARDQLQQLELWNREFGSN